MPSDVAAAHPVPDLASILAGVAFACLVKILQLECPIIADLLCFADRTHEAAGRLLIWVARGGKAMRCWCDLHVLVFSEDPYSGVPANPPLEVGGVWS